MIKEQLKQLWKEKIEIAITGIIVFLLFLLAPSHLVRP